LKRGLRRPKISIPPQRRLIQRFQNCGAAQDGESGASALAAAHHCKQRPSATSMTPARNLVVAYIQWDVNERNKKLCFFITSID
jgi:hypothetical protein